MTHSDGHDRQLEEMWGADEATGLPGYRAHALVVAGMHRTGTSAMTRVLSLRGVDLPHTLAPGAPENNDLGFWESVPVADAHDRFLASIGSAWDDVSPIPRSVFSSVKAHQFSEELGRILHAEYGDSTLFVVKDPRLCRLIPVWIAALERFGARPSFVITTRNPLEVAGSLRARDGFSATKSCLLWLRHLLDAEHDSRGYPRAFVSYEQLLRDWGSTTDQVARELHLFWPRSDHETNLQIEDFLSSALRHHSFDYSELRARSDVVEWVKRAFEAVSRAAADADEIDTELFDEIRGQLDRADQAYGPLLAQARSEIKDREAAREETEAQLTGLAEELAERQDELHELRTDNQLVTARLVEEIETVARLHRVADGVAEALAEVGRGLGDAGIKLVSAGGEPVMLHDALEQLLKELRQRTTAREEPEAVRHQVDAALTRIAEFVGVLDDERDRLLAALAERDAREAARAEEGQALEEETRRVIEALETEIGRIGEALASRETELAEALRRAEIAEAKAASSAEALQAAAEERDQLANEGARLSAAIGEREEDLAERTREYEELRAEAHRLAAAVAGAETELADARSELEAAVADALYLRETLAEREATLAESLARLERAEGEASARQTTLEEVLAERETILSEAERLADALNDREAVLAELRPAVDAKQDELAEARLELERATARLDDATSDREAWLTESEGLQATLTEQREALALAQDESVQFGRVVSQLEERLARTLDEARTLATALAESEEAVANRSAELRERTEQLLVARSEVEARDELLAGLDAIGQSRPRRWRSFTQFCSWLFPPTAEHRGYIRAYLRFRRSDLFDASYYLSRYPDVSHTGLNPLMHYVEHGRREGRQALGSPQESPLSSTTSGTAPLSVPLTPPATSAPVQPRSSEQDALLPAHDFATDLRQILSDHVPETAVIAVATGGAEHLLALQGYTTCHFPCASDGSSYGGKDASGDTALIANLEATRAAGAGFLYVPASQRSMLERNARFRVHLLGHYSSVIDSEELGICLALHTHDSSQTWRRQLSELTDWIERETSHEASVLDWDSGLQLERKLHGCNVFSFSGPELPHLDASVDIVAVATSSDERLAEAARVARQGVLEVPVDGAPPRLTASASFADQAPSVSIVIPCHEQFAHTQACIRVVAETLPTWFRGEIIIVDDASSPDTAADLQRLAQSSPHVRLLRNEVNSGFLASVNRAVEEAGGEFVVLLNNDTIPLPGWLPPLLAPFRTRDDVGAVGGRLVYPDGRLQEAGGLVFRDGSAAKFGYGDPDPDFPLFTVPREVDYCSGCLLAFRRDFFLESGGFDPAYGFGFYEDTDFCFRVRALGRIVLYEPESVIVHVEGASAGTDLTQGAKRFQALNAALFTERWHQALEHQHERPPELNRAVLQSLARRIGTP